MCHNSESLSEVWLTDWLTDWPWHVSGGWRCAWILLHKLNKRTVSLLNVCACVPPARICTRSAGRSTDRRTASGRRDVPPLCVYVVQTLAWTTCHTGHSSSAVPRRRGHVPACAPPGTRRTEKPCNRLDRNVAWSPRDWSLYAADSTTRASSLLVTLHSTWQCC